MFSRTAPAPDRGAAGRGRRPMRPTGFRAMSLVAAVLGLLVVAGVQGGSLLGAALVQCGLCVVGAVWVAVGLGRHRPAGPLPLLVAAAVALNLVATVAWYSPVLLGGEAPLAMPSPADVIWIVNALLLAAALSVALTRLEATVAILIDVAAIAIGIGVLAGVALVGPDLAASELPYGTRATQAAYAIADVFLISVALRTLLVPRPAPLALRLLALGAGALVVSDVFWNWLTISGTYLPGTWADTGWLALPVLVGLAALHPSIHALGGRAEGHEEALRFAGPLLLCVATLASPLLLGSHALLPFMPDVNHNVVTSIAVLSAGALLAGLLGLRFALLLRRARGLTAAAEAALSERTRLLELSEARHRGLLEQLPAVVVVFQLGHAEEPVLPMYVSPQAEEIMGTPAEDWLFGFTTQVTGRVHPDDRPELEAAWAAAALEGAPRPVEFRFTRPDGSEIWLRDAGGAIDEIDGIPVLQSMLFDITVAKHAEAERDRMEMELRLGQKLEAVGELAAGIAHEINTPIQFVGDTLRFLDGSFKDLIDLVAVHEELRHAAEAGAVAPDLLARAREAEDLADLEYLIERVPAAFTRADDGIHRVATIVRAMREFAHPPTAEKAPVDLNELMSNTLVVAGNAYKYVADVETEFGDLPPVVCNGGDLSQVFLNLIVNAAHAIEDVVGESGERGSIRIASRVSGDHVVFTIADTGGGIPAEVADRVFDPFFTTKEVGRGTGQGLALARAVVVERHVGSLTFETEPGVGTTFHMRLPIGQEESLLQEAKAA